MNNTQYCIETTSVRDGTMRISGWFQSYEEAQNYLQQIAEEFRRNDAACLCASSALYLDGVLYSIRKA